MNITLAGRIVRDLAKRGVKTFCLCPGGRCAPFVEVLSRGKGLEILYFFEERSACFFALGRAGRDRRPVAVVTTSGTAVAELLPGVIESRYSGFPLILITADRPLRHGKKGSPQTLENPLAILKNYMALSLNITRLKDLQLTGWSPQKGNLHLNTAFDIPLLDQPVSPLRFKPSPAPKIHPKSSSKIVNSQWSRFFQSCKHPALLVGELKYPEVKPVQNLLKNYQGPVYAEPLSRLQPTKTRLTLGESILSHGIETKEIDGVIRLGGVPRCRLWKDLETIPLPVLNLSSPPFYPGISRPSLNGPLLESLPVLSRRLSRLKFSTRLIKTDREQSKKWKGILKNHPLSEPYWMFRLKQALPKPAKVFLGNSLPIRLWDLAPCNGRGGPYDVTGQGGVNGIDGLVSRFLGECEPDRENWAILGDLSLLYDTSGFWIAPKTPPWTLVVINNFGGRIFSRLYPNPAFLNRHRLSFLHLAKMWGLEYKKYSDPGKFRFTKTKKHRLIEIRPDNRSTRLCLQAYDSLHKQLGS